MKIVNVKAVYNSGKPVVLAEGVVGGGFVGISSYNYNGGSYGIGTSESADDSSLLALVPMNETHVFYLQEGEKLYTTPAASSTSLPRNNTVVYYNNEQFSSTQSQTQTPPISLTGTIQLNQQ